ADMLAQALADAPLALDLVGRYLAYYELSPQGQPKRYLAALGQVVTRARALHPDIRQMYGIVQHTLEQFNLDNPLDALAITLLKRASYFAPNELLPISLLQATLGSYTATQSGTAESRQAINKLVAFGLIQIHSDDTLQINPLISQIARKLIQDDTAQSAVEDSLIQTTEALLNQYAAVCPIEHITAHLQHITFKHAERTDLRSAHLYHMLAQHMRWTYQMDAA